VDWEALARAGGTLVVLMGMTTRAAIAEALMRAGRSPDTPVAVIEAGTTAAQRIARTDLGGLADVDLGAPAVIVIGPVAALGADGGAGRTEGPLAGRTVVATRSGARAARLVDAMERAGATVLQLPLTRQVDAADGGAALREAAARAGGFDWVVLTSVNAVDRFMGALRDARALGGALVAAVGPATADALRRAGVEPDLVPGEHSARGLVEVFPQPAGAGPHEVLFPCADLAPDTIPDGLAERGWSVTRVEAYRTVPLAAPEPALLERVAKADAIAFAAGSSVQAFVALRGSDGGPVRVPPHVVCIGPTTAEVARAAGMSGVHEAWGSTAEGMVAELAHHFGSGPGEGS
jgi:uroporphyrinogen III methyltransferase/synthase